MMLLMVWGKSYWEVAGSAGGGRAHSVRRPGGVWRGDEFVRIALRQQSDEDAAARRGGRLLTCDTDAPATSVWHGRHGGRRLAGGGGHRQRRPVPGVDREERS
jgi:nicotinamide riboside kinase